MNYLGIYIDNKLFWDVQCDKLCSNVAGRISVLRRIRQLCRTSRATLILFNKKKQSSLFLIMPVLSDVIQNKATSQNYNGRKTTLPELLRETLIM